MNPLFRQCASRLARAWPVPTLLATLVLAAAPTAMAAAPDCLGPHSATWINLNVDRVRNASGLIAVTLYADDSSRFLVKHGSLYVARTPAVEGVTHLCLYVPNPGVYAIAVYHDEDSSGTINRSGFLGIPTEGFGFSNNPPTFASLPSFGRVRLGVTRTNLSATIHLTYP